MNRYLGALFLGVCLSSTALTGCGDDSAEDDGEDGKQQPTQGTVNEAVAASTISASTRVFASLKTGDGAGAALSMASVGSSAFAIVSYGQAGAQSAPAPDLGTATGALCEESCSGDENGGSCTFSGCTVEGGGASWTLEGTVAWTATHLDCDVAYSGSYTGLSYEMNVFCNVDYSPTSIDGEVSSDGTYSATAQNGQSAEFTWDTSIIYNDVQFPEGGGCPTSGSVDLDATIGVNGQSYTAEGSLSFPIASCAG